MVASASHLERSLAERVTAAMIVSKWEAAGQPAQRAPWPEDLLAPLILQRLAIETRAYEGGLVDRILAGHSQATVERFLKVSSKEAEPPAGVTPTAPVNSLGASPSEDEGRDPDYGNIEEIKMPNGVVIPFPKSKGKEPEEDDEVFDAEDALCAEASDKITLTDEQTRGVQKILRAVRFRAREIRLSGAAGVGKSTLMRTLVRELKARGVPFCLLGPTNQAARRLAALTECDAITIHRLIYPLPEETPAGELVFPPPEIRYIRIDGEDRPVADPSGVFVIDESSLVGKTLADDLRSVTSGTLVWLGDAAQLPPVGEPPGVDLQEAEIMLTQVHRQAEASPVLSMATAVRTTDWEHFKRPTLLGLCQKHRIPFLSATAARAASELVSLHQGGQQDAVVLTWMNKTRHEINRHYRGLRGAVDPLHATERLVICANHYHLGLLNGDVVGIKSVSWSPLPDWLSGCLGTKIGCVQLEGSPTPIYVTDLLISAERKVWAAALNVAKSIVDTIYPEESPQGATARGTINSIVLADYAYCMTAHRYQGSQAHSVILAWTQDWLWNPPGRKIEDPTKLKEAQQRFEDTRRWLYTAVTRATNHLQVINVPKDFQD